MKVVLSLQWILSKFSSYKIYKAGYYFTLLTEKRSFESFQFVEFIKTILQICISLCEVYNRISRPLANSGSKTDTKLP